MESNKTNKTLYFVGTILAFSIQIYYIIWSITNQINLEEYYDSQFSIIIFFLSINMFFLLIGGIAFGIDIMNDFKKIKKSVYIIIPFIITLMSTLGLASLFNETFSYHSFIRGEVSTCFTWISISAAIMFWGGLGIINEIIDDRM